MKYMLIISIFFISMLGCNKYINISTYSARNFFPLMQENTFCSCKSYINGKFNDKFQSPIYLSATPIEIDGMLWYPFKFGYGSYRLYKINDMYTSKIDDNVIYFLRKQGDKIYFHDELGFDDGIGIEDSVIFDFGALKGDSVLLNIFPELRYHYLIFEGKRYNKELKDSTYLYSLKFNRIPTDRQSGTTIHPSTTQLLFSMIEISEKYGFVAFELMQHGELYKCRLKKQDNGQE